MKTLSNGEFFGQTNDTLHFGGLTVTDTEYIHPYVDWHYHENAYFTFLLHGFMTEGNRKETYHCTAGSMLYHQWEDPHYNSKPDVFTRGFHIEISRDWFEEFHIPTGYTEGSFCIKDPSLKLLMYQIFKETKAGDDAIEVSVNQLLINLFGQLSRQKELNEKRPAWVNQLDEILHENYTDKLNLTALSETLNIHPVHLSRNFARYFNCNLGEYIRKMKVDRSLLLLNTYDSLTEVALECGFADQSHFIRCFKENIGITPMKYRQLMKK